MRVGGVQGVSYYGQYDPSVDMPSYLSRTSETAWLWRVLSPSTHSPSSVLSAARGSLRRRQLLF